MGTTSSAIHYLFNSFLLHLKLKLTMRGLAVVTLALLAVVAYSQDGPVFDEYKRIHCNYLFPNTKNYVAGRLNETVNRLEGNYFGIRAGVDAALDKVVAAQAAACLTIEKLIAGVKTTT